MYIYLVHHAEAEPDTALLSINTIQKSLSDSNPQLRALALRVMSGIRVPVISQIVQLGIKRGVGDMSPYVRKAAALAIPKCYRLDPAALPQLLEYLTILLGDKQYYVAGAAVAAFLDMCPDRLDLIHKHYRGLVRKLVDMDEWSQLATLRLMIVYGRRCFPRKTRLVKRTKVAQREQSHISSVEKFYDDEGATGQDEHGDDETEETTILDPDLELLLSSAKPLLQSRNPAVIVAVVACYLYLGNTTYLDSAVGPLVALLRGPRNVRHIALHNLVQVCLARPQPFLQYASHFLVRASDPAYIWSLKLEVLTLIFPHADIHLKGLILSELEHFSRGRDLALVRESVRAIGRCAQSDARTAPRCMRLLLKQLNSPDPHLVAEALEVVRHLIQQAPEEHVRTVIRLAKSLDTTTSPQARACIIWLVGEFAGIQPQNNIAADVLRILAKGFADETEAAKLQIVLLAAKVYVHHLNSLPQKATEPPRDESYGSMDQDPNTIEMSTSSGIGENVSEREHPISVLWRYVLLLARYDTSYDLRDRARVYKALLAVPSSTELANLLLLAPKPVPQAPSPSENRERFTIGSASLLVASDGVLGGLKGYEPLPDWVQSGNEPDPRLRDEGPTEADYGHEKQVSAGDKLDSALQAQGVQAVSKKADNYREKTLDDWLAEDEQSSKAYLDKSEEEEEEVEDDDSEESDETSEEESSAEETEDESDHDKDH